MIQMGKSMPCLYEQMAAVPAMASAQQSGNSNNSSNNNSNNNASQSYEEMLGGSSGAENSYCERRQVGALIVKDKMIISDGYNGTPAGFENVCEDDNGVTKPYVLHAEANAITKIARSNNSSDGATMYVTASPCIECAKLIIQAGIKRVVYSEKYRLEDGIELLKRAGIEVVYVATSDELQATSAFRCAVYSLTLKSTRSL